MSDVVVIKLLSGEELIGTVVGDSSSHLTLDNILMVQYEMKAPGQLGFGFLPFSPLTESRKTFQREHIVYETHPKDTLAQAYNQVTGKLVTPTKELIIG